MIVAALTVEIHISASQSLKDKRSVLKSIKDRVKNKFNVAYAEIDYQDKWQRATLAFVTVSASKSMAEEIIQKVFRILDNDVVFEIVKYQFEFR